MDIAKQPTVGDWIVHQLFPCLAPGSIVIQQDFVHDGTPWVVVASGYFELSGHLRFVTAVDSSAVYACENPVPRPLARAFVYEALRVRERWALFDYASRHFQEPHQRRLLAAARAHVRNRR